MCSWGLDWLYASGRIDPPLIIFGQSLGASLTTSVVGRDANQGKGDCVILEAFYRLPGHHPGYHAPELGPLAVQFYCGAFDTG